MLRHSNGLMIQCMKYFASYGECCRLIVDWVYKVQSYMLTKRTITHECYTFKDEFGSGILFDRKSLVNLNSSITDMQSETVTRH